MSDSSNTSSSTVNATAAAILSSLGSGYAPGAGHHHPNAGSYSAALYYHPYYSAHHYLNHTNVVPNLNPNTSS